MIVSGRFLLFVTELALIFLYRYILMTRNKNKLPGNIIECKTVDIIIVYDTPQSKACAVHVVSIIISQGTAWSGHVKIGTF